MLKAILSFFRKEPKYFWFLLAVLGFYGFAMLGPQPKELATKPSKEMTDFRVAEEKWTQNMGQEGAFEDFAKREPVLAVLFEIMTLFFFLAFLIGGVLDVLRIWKPDLFQKFRTDLSPPVTQAWPFAILFKVVILVAFFGILLSFLIGMVLALFPKWDSGNTSMIFHALALDAVCLYFMVMFVIRSGGQWQDLGFRVPGQGFLREVGAGLAGYVGILPVFAVILVALLGIAEFFHYEPPAHPLVNVFLDEEKRAPFLFALSVLLGTVIGPIVEEIFFRGFCYPILRNRWGKFWGMVLSAAFFAGIHHSGFVFWPVFVLGIALAYLYEVRRSLIASITLHITHNTLFIGYFFLIKQIIAK